MLFLASQRRRHLKKFASRIKLRVIRSLRLIDQALTHSSFANEMSNSKTAPSAEDNEKLEFLGDAVLGLVISRYLFKKHPELQVGETSKIKAEVVSKVALLKLAEEIRIGEVIRLGKGASTAITGRHKESILADSVEALIGAIYLDTGLWSAQSFILNHWGTVLEEAVARIGKSDYKSMLQEMVQRTYKTIPNYRIVSQNGPEHDKIFESYIFISGKKYGRGIGHSKKEAEQEAAKQALRSIEEGSDR